MTYIPPNHMSRLELIVGIVAFAATPAFAIRRAPVVLHGANPRTIHRYASPTGEIMDTVSWADGEYIAPVLEEINYFMRDWRAGRAAEIDPSLIGLLREPDTPVKMGGKLCCRLRRPQNFGKPVPTLAYNP